LLRYLVWSMSYVWLKNVICSNLNYLGTIDTMTSKVFWGARIVLKCQIDLLVLACAYLLIKLKVIHIYIIILNYFAESKYMYIFAMQSGEKSPINVATSFFEISSKTRATIEFGQIYCLPLDYVISRLNSPKRLTPIHMVPTG